ncbi:ankyrin repeat domain-containing protein, partial [Synechococcus sp. F70.1]
MSEALHRALADGDSQRLLDYLQQGEDVNAPDWQGLTPLHKAVLSGNLELVDLLLAHGASVHALDPTGA